MSDLSHRQAICALADVAERLAVLEDGLWRVRAQLRLDHRPEAAEVSELLVLVLEASEAAFAAEFTAAKEMAASAIRSAMRGDEL
jgi:hypothetical protein